MELLQFSQETLCQHLFHPPVSPLVKNWNGQSSNHTHEFTHYGHPSSSMVTLFCHENLDTILVIASLLFTPILCNGYSPSGINTQRWGTKTQLLILCISSKSLAKPISVLKYLPSCWHCSQIMHGSGKRSGPLTAPGPPTSKCCSVSKSVIVHPCCSYTSNDLHIKESRKQGHMKAANSHN